MDPIIVNNLRITEVTAEKGLKGIEDAFRPGCVTVIFIDDDPGVRESFIAKAFSRLRDFDVDVLVIENTPDAIDFFRGASRKHLSGIVLVSDFESGERQTGLDAINMARIWNSDIPAALLSSRAGEKVVATQLAIAHRLVTREEAKIQVFSKGELIQGQMELPGLGGERSMQARSQWGLLFDRFIIPAIQDKMLNIMVGRLVEAHQKLISVTGQPLAVAEAAPKAPEENWVRALAQALQAKYG